MDYYYPVENAWDPFAYEHEEPSPQCLHRLKTDIADFYRNPLVGISIFPEDNNVTKLHAIIEGPPGTPYDGGFFHFLIKFSQDYPMTPPRVRFMTTDGGRVSFHSNLFATGRVSLSILGKFAGPEWRPALGLEHVLIWLQSFFLDKYYYGKNYNSFLQQETIRVAVCGMVEAALQDSPECPRALQEHVLKSFSKTYSKYVGIVRSNRHLTGSAVSRSGLDGRVFRFEPLLTRLKELEKKVKDKLEVSAGGGNQ